MNGSPRQQLHPRLWLQSQQLQRQLWMHPGLVQLPIQLLYGLQMFQSSRLSLHDAALASHLQNKLCDECETCRMKTETCRSVWWQVFLKGRCYKEKIDNIWYQSNLIVWKTIHDGLFSSKNLVLAEVRYTRGNQSLIGKVKCIGVSSERMTTLCRPRLRWSRRLLTFTSRNEEEPSIGNSAEGKIDNRPSVTTAGQRSLSQSRGHCIGSYFQANTVQNINGETA